MKNKTAIDTFNVLSQLNNEKGFPLKFEYGLVKILSRLDPVVKSIHAVSSRKIDGQQTYEAERVELLEANSDKDEKGKPILIKNGTEYQISDKIAFGKKVEKLNKKYESVLAAIEDRKVELEKLLDSEAEDFEPYMVDIKYLPVKEGLSQLSVLQLKYMMPFLDGDIEDIPDYEGD